MKHLIFKEGFNKKDEKLTKFASGDVGRFKPVLHKKDSDSSYKGSTRSKRSLFSKNKLKINNLE